MFFSMSVVELLRQVKVSTFTQKILCEISRKKIQTGKLLSFVVFEIFLKIDHCKIYDFIA